MSYPQRLCALCDSKIRAKERLCEQHKREYADQLDAPWLQSLIDYTSYAYNVARRDVKHKVQSLDKLKGRY